MVVSTEAKLITADPAWSLDRDLRAAAAQLGEREVRFLVNRYYGIQDDRKRSAQQRDAAAEAGDPNLILQRLFGDSDRMEKNIKYALDKWSRTDPACQWARSIPGIGPVLASGLKVHTHMEHCPTVGHLWSFAGLNPEMVWAKGQKRPFNAALKTLCWKIGECFVKVSNKEDDFYGHIYRDRRAWEGQQNELLKYADQAAAILARVPNHKQKETYAQGKLPDSHLHSRAKRYAVKLFLAHWHHVCHELTFGTPPPRPYVMEHRPGLIGSNGLHAHVIEVPNWPMESIERRRNLITTSA